jgi:hypothetical protein
MIDPGVGKRRRISFGTRNLFGSSQDDVKFRGKNKSVKKKQVPRPWASE